MWAGFHYLEDSDEGTVCDAACFLDTAGSERGMQSPERLCRMYFKGVPSWGAVVAFCEEWGNRNCRLVIGNEPNLPVEGWAGGVEALADLYVELGATAIPGRLYWPGMSPGVAGWEQWYTSSVAAEGIAHCQGITVHCYGSGAELRRPIEVVRAAYPTLPVWVSEVNFGAGREVNAEQWAQNELRPFLDWCHQQGVEAASYFAYVWPSPDMQLATPVDAKGTAIEGVVREWRPPGG